MGMILRPGKKGRKSGVWNRNTESSFASQAGSFRPMSVGGGNIKLWLRGDLGITLGTTPKASGTTPPVVTISGTPTGLYGLHIEIDSVAGGTGLGQATFKWSVDNGTTYKATGVLTAASVVLGATGITAAFAAGPYNVDNKYDGRVSSWADQSGASNTVTQATVGQQGVLLVADKNNKAVINFKAATTERMAKAATNLFGAGAYTIFMVLRVDAFTSGDVYFGQSTGSGGMQLDVSGTTRDITHVLIENHTDTTFPTSTYEIWSVVRPAATAPSLWINGTSTAVTQVTSTLTDPGGTCILNIWLAASDGKAAEYIAYSTNLSTNERHAVERYLGQRYGIGVAVA